MIVFIIAGLAKELTALPFYLVKNSIHGVAGTYHVAKYCYNYCTAPSNDTKAPNKSEEDEWVIVTDDECE